ncbi:hypothetical protein DPMN_015602 [Dreissena polymorpha]|uniref:Uncharacterized protein n=1 Tax=Dreissena polymorpha TaxID=45954 RepID=A0A9D4N828_DREPO|nr:hypothetical protein DPMN_015602 [Dreissena polymorpha]
MAAFIVAYEEGLVRLQYDDVTVRRVNVDQYDFTVTDGQYVITASTSQSVDDMSAKLLLDTDVTVENIGWWVYSQWKRADPGFLGPWWVQGKALLGDKDDKMSNRRATSDDDHDTFNHDLVKIAQSLATNQNAGSVN